RHHRGDVGAVALDAVGAVIDPAGVGILHDDHAAGADVVAAVVLVPARGRDLEEIDRAAAGDVLQERTGVDRHRRDRLGVLHVATPELHQLHLRRLGRHAEGEVDAPHRGEDVRDHAIARRIAGYVVEQDGRAAARALVDVDDAADLLLALGTADRGELAGFLQGREPGAQVLVRRLVAAARRNLAGRRFDRG